MRTDAKLRLAYGGRINNRNKIGCANAKIDTRLKRIKVVLFSNTRLTGNYSGQPTFLTQNLHQAEGLIVPSTRRQEFGGRNTEQLLHCWSPLGVS